MLETKRSNRRFSLGSVLSLMLVMGGILLTACTLFEAKGAKTGNSDFGDAVPLFKASLPNPENKTWSYESGNANSAVGEINPVILGSASPLRYPGQKIVFNLFEGAQFVAVVEKVKAVTGGDQNHFVSAGRIDGIDGSSFMVSTLGNEVGGIVRLGAAGSFRLSYDADNNYRVAKLNDYQPDANPMDPVEGVMSTAAKFALAKKSSSQATSNVNVLVLYTDSAYSKDHSITTKIDLAFDELNDVMDNNGLDIQFTVAHKDKIHYAESYNLDTDLVSLKTVGDTTLDTAQTLRTSNNADIVTLVVDSVSDTSSVARGYLLSKVVDSLKVNAYNVVKRSSLALGQYALEQAIGYNMGCQNDAKTKIVTTKAPYTYSHGYVFKVGTTTYRTIMTSGVGTRIPYFSSPKTSYLGKAVGSATANNALVIQNTAPTVAGYYGTNSAPTASMTFPITGSTFGGLRVVLKAAVTDDEGLDSVVFFKSTTKLAKLTAAPWKYVFTDTAAGVDSFKVVAYDKGGLSTASTMIGVTLGTSGLSAPFNDAYLGAKGENGLASLASSTYKVVTKSSGLTGKADDFQYAYKTFSGNGRIIATVHTASHDAFGGLMFRDTLAQGARTAVLGMGSDGEASLYYRSTRTASLALSKTATSALDAYLMLVRKGTTVAAYYAPNGNDWTYINKVTIATLPTSIYSGFAGTSNDSTAKDSVTFQHYSTDTSSNFPPTVTLSGAADGATVDSAASITLTATAADVDGETNLSKVKFFYGTTLLATDSTKPYSTVWTAVPNNAAVLSARVFDKSGDSSYSNSITLKVLEDSAEVLNPSKDSYVRNGTKYLNTNYGNATTIYVKDTLTTGDGNLYKGIMTFNIASINVSDSLATASLRLNAALSADDTAGVKVKVYKLADTTYTEIGVKYSNFPTLGVVIDSFTVTSTTPSWKSVNVTSYIKAEKVAGHTSTSFALLGGKTSTAMAVIKSRTTTDGAKPQLEIHE